VTALTLPTAEPRPLRTTVDGSSARRQLTTFVVVGALTTVAYLVLYAVLRPSVGDQIANAVALVLTADANTIANRRFGFALTGPESAVRHHAQGFVAYGVSLALTSGSLAVLEARGVTSGAAHVAVLLAANAVGGLVHFGLLRSWVFARAAR
jgi:putative flippase GtrA